MNETNGDDVGGAPADEETTEEPGFVERAMTAIGMGGEEAVDEAPVDPEPLEISPTADEPPPDTTAEDASHPSANMAVNMELKNRAKRGL